VRVDVEGSLDRFLEQPLGGLALVQAGSILVRAQAGERAQGIKRRHDVPKVTPDDRRVDRAHASPLPPKEDPNRALPGRSKLGRIAVAARGE
jgi:hypothetical protein